MPAYDAACNDCGHITEYRRSYKDYLDVPACEACGGETHKVILQAAMVGAMGLTGGSFSIISPIDGTEVHGKSEYEAHMKKHNVMHASEFKGQAEVVRKEKAATQAKELRAAATEAYKAVINK